MEKKKKKSLLKKETKKTSNFIIEKCGKNKNNLKIVAEASSNNKKDYFIEGVFMSADEVNRNGRIYPSKVLDESVQKYIKEYVHHNRAIGELDHPDNAEINLDRVSHIVTHLEKRGKDYYGRAKILPTPCGEVVKGLLEGNVQLGVSLRALAESTMTSEGVEKIEPGMELLAIDIVHDPSAHRALVSPVTESRKRKIVKQHLNAKNLLKEDTLEVSKISPDALEIGFKDDLEKNAKLTNRQPDNASEDEKKMTATEYKIYKFLEWVASLPTASDDDK